MKLPMQCYKRLFLRTNFSFKFDLDNFNICEISEYEKDSTYFKSYNLVCSKIFKKPKSHM